VLGRSWVTKGGSGVRKNSAEECEPADNKSSDIHSFFGGFIPQLFVNEASL
jgi:hypothetical protein